MSLLGDNLLVVQDTDKSFSVKRPDLSDEKSFKFVTPV